MQRQNSQYDCTIRVIDDKEICCDGVDSDSHSSADTIDYKQTWSNDSANTTHDGLHSPLQTLLIITLLLATNDSTMITVKTEESLKLPVSMIMVWTPYLHSFFQVQMMKKALINFSFRLPEILDLPSKISSSREPGSLKSQTHRPINKESDLPPLHPYMFDQADILLSHLRYNNSD